MHMVEEYVNASKFQYKDALDVIEEFGKEISEMRGRCIDIGCGPGNVTKTLLLPRLAAEAELVGADISKEMVEYAREKCSDEKRLSFICLDVQTGDLPNELVAQFSNAFSFFCLHWCENPWRTFGNIWKMLRPGGTALTMFLARNDGFDVYMDVYENPLYRPFMQDVDRYVPYYHRCKDQRSSLRKVLEDTGFDVLHCSKRQKSYVYQNKLALKKHVAAVNPFVNRFPEELRDDFMEEISQGIVKQKILFKNQEDCSDQENKILDIYDILVAYVRKPLGS
nr:juvenile hormone acid O-methyltransferase isoform X1 [Megalopta genalis]XP_033336743.1 juvenile hormone acid O-methyltransferase isoform X1 [Megalopta genalis]XP_033336744.1 juvenile hormone acid O-methyltransferase isoform X1 [Megalopta genalis]XP_033336745.1 juvenile hormone acid O-methyltransferase isoform X1 [Megalopta genalis]XP_033336746.1 juvenile hormone acid O-methyltransferase isoform X1 [Megalopta genalis]XP_033336747.1 juvenile hormone acid O-methyltransferase isoform X1 [Megalo